MTDIPKPPNSSTPPLYAPVFFDMERMEKALQGPTFTVPPGLTREQVRQHMLDVVKKHGK